MVDDSSFVDFREGIYIKLNAYSQIFPTLSSNHHFQNIGFLKGLSLKISINHPHPAPPPPPFRGPSAADVAQDRQDHHDRPLRWAMRGEKNKFKDLPSFRRVK